MKKIGKIWLMSFMVLSVCSVLTAQQKANPPSDFKYDLTEDGNGIVIQEYRGSSLSVVVPAEIEGYPVTVIGAGAFYYAKRNKEITSVWLPDTVVEIESNAFYKCEKLLEVRLPPSLEEIHSYCFAGAKALKSITLPKNIKTIGYMAFSDCSALVDVIVPENVTSIKYPDIGNNGSNGDAFWNTRLSLRSKQALKNTGYDGKF